MPRCFPGPAIQQTPPPLPARRRGFVQSLLHLFVPLSVLGGLLLGTLPVVPAVASDPGALVVELTNVERQKAGLEPVSSNPYLTLSADGYARVLAASGCWGHACGPVPDFRQRNENAGYTDWTYLGENIAGGQRTAERVVAAWLASPGHRANMLKPTYRDIGVSLAYGGNYGVYWVQEFGAQRDGSSQVSTYYAAWLAQSPIPSLAPGAQALVWVDLRNVGTATWSRDGSSPVRLGTFNPQDRVSAFATPGRWLSPNRPTALQQAVVPPGQVGRFAFELTAPNAPGTYREYFRPVAEGLTWFNDLGIYFETVVAAE